MLGLLLGLCKAVILIKPFQHGMPTEYQEVEVSMEAVTRHVSSAACFTGTSKHYDAVGGLFFSL